MSLLPSFLFAAAALSHGPFEILPEPTGPINGPKPPATIRTVEGRIYECHPQEGEDAYRDVTPPDEQTHWRMRFGSTRLPPQGTGSYHPPEDWPFRAIVSSSNPAAMAADARLRETLGWLGGPWNLTYNQLGIVDQERGNTEAFATDNTHIHHIHISMGTDQP